MGGTLDGSTGLTNLGARQYEPSTGRFAATQVLMADGSHRSIEDIRPGDEVTATDPETGQTGPRTVTRLIVTASDSDSDSDKEFVTLTVDTPEGPRNLTATAEHPFWSVSGHEWLPAEDLRPVTTLRSEDGSVVPVTATRFFTRSARTYNLSVDGLHTYYVLAGSTAQLRGALVKFLTLDTYKPKGGKTQTVVRTARDIEVATSLIEVIDDAHAGKYTGLGDYKGLGTCP